MGQMRSVAIAALVAIAGLVGATAAAAQGTKVRSIHIVRAVYPDAARSAGHQGQVRLTATIQLDGSLSDVKIVESSRSALLDAAARDAFAQWRFETPKNAKGIPAPFPFDYTLTFYKVPLLRPAEALKTFACRDFVADIDWFEATFPKRDRTELNDYMVFLAPITFRPIAGGAEMDAMLAAGRAVRAKRAALDLAATLCRETPDSLLLRVLAEVEAGQEAVR